MKPNIKILAREGEKEKRRKYLFLFIPALILLGLFIFYPVAFFKGLLVPVSVFSQVTGQKLQSTDGRTNILILGLDKRVGETSGRTDTILLGSVGLISGDAALISVPRDLWIPTLAGKINSAYVTGGAPLAQKTLEKILGIPIHYYAVVDFTAFEKAIDIVGGVTVNVDRAFTDNYYPIDGQEDATCGLTVPAQASEAAEFSFPCRYEHLQFNQGEQLLDGQRALKFVRSRHASGDDGTDYARAARQQKVIEALAKRFLSWDVLLDPQKAQALFTTFRAGIETNVGFFEAENLYALAKKVNFSQIRTVILDENNVLYNPPMSSDYGGVWVLIPRGGDFSGVSDFVEKFLFGEITVSPTPL